MLNKKNKKKWINIQPDKESNKFFKNNYKEVKKKRNKDYQ